jgi:hypothetical protein
MAPDCSTIGSGEYRRPSHTPPSRSVLSLHQSISHTIPLSTSAPRIQKDCSTTHQSRQRQPISKSGHRCFEIVSLEINIDVLALHRRVHVCPHKRDGAPLDAPSLVRDLDCDVFCAFYYNQFDWWKRRRFGFGAEALHNGAQGVFEQLEEDVGPM